MPGILTPGYALSITPGKFFFARGGGAINPMQTVHETRKARLLLLKKKYVKWANMNRVLGWEPTSARLSQIGSGAIRSKRDTPYIMGDDMAREIEVAFGLELGWMDTPLTYEELSGDDNQRAKVHCMVQEMPPEMVAVAYRLLSALAQPAQANGQPTSN